MISSKSIISIFLICFSIILRSKIEATLLVIMISPYWFALITLAIILDLMFFRALLILAMYLPDNTMNFDVLVELIETITYEL